MQTYRTVKLGNLFNQPEPQGQASTKIPMPAPAQGYPRGVGVEVKDADTGAYIAGAKVSLLGPAGVMFSMITDAEGKALLSAQGKREAELFPDRSLPVEAYSYRVEMEGYSTQEKPLVGRDIVAFDLKKKGFLGIPTWGWVAGGAVAAVAFLSLRD